MSLPVGFRLGPYEILEAVGAGGMGEVYRARDTKLNRSVAIKVILAGSDASGQAQRRLLGEARAAAGLDHPNICAIHEVSEADGRAFIVMQYVEGETLQARLKRAPLTMAESLSIAAHVVDALVEAHAHGTIHRDIKPSNIMLTPRGGVKVLDFGLAMRAADASTGEASGGNPERAHGDGCRHGNRAIHVARAVERRAARRALRSIQLRRDAL